MTVCDNGSCQHLTTHRRVGFTNRIFSTAKLLHELMQQPLLIVTTVYQVALVKQVDTTESAMPVGYVEIVAALRSLQPRREVVSLQMPVR